MHIYTYTYKYINTALHKQPHTNTIHTCSYIHTYIHKHIHAHIHINTYLHIHMQTNTHTHMHTQVCMHMHAHIHTPLDHNQFWGHSFHLYSPMSHTPAEGRLTISPPSSSLPSSLHYSRHGDSLVLEHTDLGSISWTLLLPGSSVYSALFPHTSVAPFFPSPFFLN